MCWMDQLALELFKAGQLGPCPLVQVTRGLDEDVAVIGEFLLHSEY